MAHKPSQLPDDEWVEFPGGELEGKRPKVRCSPCREQLARAAVGGEAAIDQRGLLCFQCYRAELDRDKLLRASGELDTASEQRFQLGFPFEPVNRPRLTMLKAERGIERAQMRAGVGRFADRRRQSQIAARHALQSIACGLKAPVSLRLRIGSARLEAAVHAAELQLPESWLPFVVAR